MRVTRESRTQQVTAADLLSETSTDVRLTDCEIDITILISLCTSWWPWRCEPLVHAERALVPRGTGTTTWGPPGPVPVPEYKEEPGCVLEPEDLTACMAEMEARRLALEERMNARHAERAA